MTPPLPHPVWFIGHLHNTAELDAACDLPAGTDDRTRIAQAWRTWGTDMPERLQGDWSLAVEAPGETFLARDPVGMKPLFYRIDGDRLHYGFSVAELLRKVEAPATPDPDWMARYLIGLSLSHDRTAYREIFRLPPGHWLLHRPGQPPRIQPYHHWHDDAPDARRRDPARVAAYREALETALHRRMASEGAMGVETSGGIDSSTVLAFLARFVDDPAARLHGFGFALMQQEQVFIAASTRAAGLTQTHIFSSSPDELQDDDAILHSLRILGMPAEHTNATWHRPFYEECRRQGIATLYSGFGGDEVVTNPGDLLTYELVDKGRLAALMRIKPGPLPIRALRMAKTATVARRKPPYRPTMRTAFAARWPAYLLRDEVAQPLREQYMRQAAYDGPYRSVNGFILGHLLQQPFIHIRMENCTIMAAAYGVEYRWPLLDAGLIQHYLSTPSIEKFGPRGIGRYLHRRAIDGVVPHEIAWKPSKDMGAPLNGGHDLATPPRDLTTARRHAAHLHPTLAALIDRDKLRARIQAAEAGTLDLNQSVAFRTSLRALRALNLWLHDGPLPE